MNKLFVILFAIGGQMRCIDDMVVLILCIWSDCASWSQCWRAKLEPCNPCVWL